jgi:hypothetical protein
VGKRANGEGSIYERKDGRWVASITLENGKRKSVYGATKQEAVQAKQKLLNSKDQGVIQLTHKQTVGVFLSSWLEDVVKANQRPHTYLNRKYSIGLVTSVLGDIPLYKLTARHIQRVYTIQRERGLKTSTLDTLHRMLVSAFNYAVKHSLLKINPMKLVDRARPRRPEMKVLSAE